MPSGASSTAGLVKAGAINDYSIDGFWFASLLTLYIERVRPSLNTAENEITISFDPDGSDPDNPDNWSRPETIYVADPPTLSVDAMNASSGLPDTGSDGNFSEALAQYNQQLQTDPSQPGKIIVVDDNLVSGVPAFADFSGDNNTQFVPMVVTLPQGTNLNNAMLQFDYSGSDPTAVRNVGSTIDPDFEAAPGALRLWTVDGDEPRNVEGINDGGNYITPDTPFPASALGETWITIPNTADMEAIVYVEAIRPSTSTGDQTITLTVDMDGTGIFIAGGSARLTVVQDTAPDYSGSGLAGVAQGADGGNPMSNAFSGSVRLFDGVVNYATTDFSVPGTGFDPTVSRIWTDQPGLVINPSFGNGEIMTQLPYLIQATGTIIAVIDGQPYYFDQISPNVYKERFFGLEQLTYDSANDQYQFVDTTGTRIVFNGFTIQDENDPAQGMYERGAMKSVTDADGNTITVTQYDSLGNTTEVTEGSDVFSYTYDSVADYEERLASVSLVRNGHTIAEAQYTYYTADDPSDNGNDGDLQQVRVSTSAGYSSPMQEVDGSYYRYEAPSYGYPYGDLLEYSVTGLAYARLVAHVIGPKATSAASGSGAANALDSFAYGDLEPYADQFSYDDQNRADYQAIVGDGASSPDDLSATGAFHYGYDNDGQSRGVGINAWNQETTITLPGDEETTQTVYTNFAGEPMLSTITDPYDSISPALNNLTWNTFYAYDPQGRLVLTAGPSTPMQPNPLIPDLLNDQSGTFQLMSSDQGLIEGTDYYASGPMTGYVEGTYVQDGQQASTKALQDSYQYATISGDGISVYPVSDDTEFSAATSNAGNYSGRDTHFAYQNSGLHITQVTETLPQVTAGQNSLSGTGTIITDYDSYGRVADMTDADGYKTTYSYDDPTGTVTQTVTVVNLTTGATVTTSSVPDLLGRPVQTTDGDGEITNIQYVDGLLQSTVTTTAQGGPTQMVVSNTGQGTVTTLATVPNGSLQAVSEVRLDYAGRTVQTETYDGPTDTSTTEDMYDDAGQLYWSEDADGTVTITDYDGLGRVVSTWVGTDGTDCGGGETPVSNSDGTDMVEISADVYDNGGVGDGNLTETIDFPAGANYSPDNPPAPDALAVTQMFYDWQDRLIATKSGALVAEESSLATGQTGFQVDGLDETMVFDSAGEGADGDTTQRPITYDTLDNLGEVTGQYVYDGNGVSIACGAGVSPAPPAANLLRAETTTSYNAQGQEYQSDVYSVDQSTGNVGVNPEITKTLYDCDGNVISTTDPRNKTTTDSYDGLGNLVSTTDADNGTTYYTYDADGNQVTETDPMGDTTTNTYNRLDQLVSTIDANGATTRYTYDAAGNQLTETDPLGNTTTSTYDDIGQLLSTTDANGATTYHTYDGDGNQLTETDPDGNVNYDTYDDLDQLISQTQLIQLSSGAASVAATTSYQYDADGNLIQQTDPDGRVTVFSYNDLDQETGEQWYASATAAATGPSAASNAMTFTYDSDGDLLTAQDDYSSYTYGYNGFGEQTSVDNNGSGPSGATGTPGVPDVVLSSGYDPAGNRTSLSATIDGKADFVNNYQYDDANQELQVTQGPSGYDAVDDKLVNFTYYADGQVKSIDRFNDLSASPSDRVATSAYDYNDLDELTSLTSTAANGTTTYAAYGWTYYANGEVKTFTNSATIADYSNENIATYTYDHDGQLTGATQPNGKTANASNSFANPSYDANGNAGTINGTSDDNRHGQHPAFRRHVQLPVRCRRKLGPPDADLRAQEAADYQTIYTWDNRNRLTDVTFENNSGKVTSEVQYTYDMFNNLIGRTYTTYESDGVTVATSTTQRYVFDGSNMVLAFNGSGSLTDRFLWGPLVDQLLSDEQLSLGADNFRDVRRHALGIGRQPELGPRPCGRQRHARPAHRLQPVRPGGSDRVGQPGQAWRE